MRGLESIGEIDPKNFAKADNTDDNSTCTATIMEDTTAAVTPEKQKDLNTLYDYLRLLPTTANPNKPPALRQVNKQPQDENVPEKTYYIHLKLR